MRSKLVALGIVTIAIAACAPEAVTDAEQAYSEAPDVTRLTESQARDRILMQGLVGPSELAQGEDGTWSATATAADGQKVQVLVDTHGYVTTAAGQATPPGEPDGAITSDAKTGATIP